MSTTDRPGAMSTDRRNKRKLAVLIQSAYDLTADEVEEVLRHAELVKRGDARLGQMHTRGGRTLTIETFVHAPLRET